MSSRRSSTSIGRAAHKKRAKSSRAESLAFRVRKMCVQRGPSQPSTAGADQDVPWCSAWTRAERGVKFSFAVVSDTHDNLICRKEQGALLADAARLINRLRPDFVVGLGDIIAGGGDCRDMQRGRWHSASQQLAELRRTLLEKLQSPFLPVSGNHDFVSTGSKDTKEPRRAWRAFWKKNSSALVPPIRSFDMAKSFRFTYKGVGIAVISNYGTTGLRKQEMKWVRDNVRPGDLVFRHVNPYGVSCIYSGQCGISVGHQRMRRPQRLVRLLKKRRIRALFSGHTHSFFDGDCDGIHFVNTGALGERSMEYLKGWERSPYARRQAFVWVDVLKTGEVDVTFYVWTPKCKCFRRFDPRHFPAVINVKPVARVGQVEGVRATCIARRSSRPLYAVERRAPSPKPGS